MNIGIEISGEKVDRNCRIGVIEVTVAVMS